LFQAPRSGRKWPGRPEPTTILLMATRSLIVKFDSRESRDAFAERVAGTEPKLRDHMYLSKRRAEAVVEDLSDDERELIAQLVGSGGEIYEDVKFEPMDEPAARSANPRS
jgi:hypothetical protein